MILPYLNQKMRVGILGGSFDPAHGGHIKISEIAIKKLNLDKILWFVSPQNPFKQHNPADINDRINYIHQITNSREIIATDFEKRFKPCYTYQSISMIQNANPGVDFVFMVGADLVPGFHKWYRWKNILEKMPICIFNRDSNTHQLMSYRLCQYYKNYLVISDSCYRGDLSSYNWYCIKHQTVNLSSTEIRKKGFCYE